jgi:hypothetical protein
MASRRAEIVKQYRTPHYIEPLDSGHDRASIRCGVASLDDYIRKQARQDVKRRINRVFVAFEENRPNIILGYYTLSTLAIDLSDLPQTLVRKLARHPLAVSDEIAIYTMVVDAIDERAKRFYEKFSFVSLSSGGSRLFLPLKSV